MSRNNGFSIKDLYKISHYNYTFVILLELRSYDSDRSFVDDNVINKYLISLRYYS